MILGELNGAFGVDGSSCAWEDPGPSSCSMLFSSLASSLWSHSFHLGLALYPQCLPMASSASFFVFVFCFSFLKRFIL